MAVDLTSHALILDSSLPLSVSSSDLHKQDVKSGVVVSGTLFGRDVITVQTDFNNLPLKSPEERLDFLSQKVSGFDRQLFRAHNGNIVKNQDAFNFSIEEQQEIEEIIEMQFRPLHQKATNVATAKMWFQVVAIISAIVSSLFTLVAHLGLVAASAYLTPISIVGGVSFAASFIASWYESSKREELKEIATGIENRRQQKIIEICRSQTMALDNFFDVVVNGKIVDEENQNTSSNSTASIELFNKQ